MKNKRNLKIICLILTIVMTLSIMPVVAVGERVPVGDRRPVSISAELTSAIDGSPFMAYFDPLSGRISFVGIDGQSQGHRYVESEEVFWEMVAINAKVTSPEYVEQRIGAMINRNVSWTNLESRTLIVYDEHGNRTETYIGEEVAEWFSEYKILAWQEGGVTSYYEITPHFNTGLVHMLVPFADFPGRGIGALVGGSYHQTPWTATHVMFEVGSPLPVGMLGVNVWITNQIGDCNTVVPNMRPGQMVHSIRFPGEHYGAWVSSFQANFFNVPLRFNAAAISNSITIFLNPTANGAQVSPSTIVRVRGSTFGNLPTPTVGSAARFIDWSSTIIPVSGSRIRSNSIVPNQTGMALFARWTDPTRHLDFWWTPTLTGTTVIPIRSTVHFEQQVSSPTIWQNAMNSAIVDWSSSSTTSGVRFVPETGARSRVVVIYDARSFYGELREVERNGNVLSVFDAVVNARYVTNRAGSNIVAYARSVTNHELGHAIGLRDNPHAQFGNHNGSLMNQRRDRSVVISPTSFDIDSAMIIYR